MSNSCNQNPTLSNTAETVKNERRIKLSPLRWSVLVQEIGNDRFYKLVLGNVYIHSSGSWRFSRCIWSRLYGRKYINFCNYPTLFDITFLYIVEKRKKEKQEHTKSISHCRVVLNSYSVESFSIKSSQKITKTLYLVLKQITQFF